MVAIMYLLGKLNMLVSSVDRIKLKQLEASANMKRLGIQKNPMVNVDMLLRFWTGKNV
jgi:hypothetical protein